MKWFTSTNVNNYLIKNNEIFSQKQFILKEIHRIHPEIGSSNYFEITYKFSNLFRFQADPLIHGEPNFLFDHSEFVVKSMISFNYWKFSNFYKNLSVSHDIHRRNGSSAEKSAKVKSDFGYGINS